MDSRSVFLRSCYPVLAPLALLLALILLFGGTEESVASFFEYCRAAAPDAKQAVSVFTKYGSVPFYALWAAILAMSVRNRDRRGIRLVGYYILFLLLALLIADILKIWIGRPRPGEFGGFMPFTLRRSYHSFPSNHVMEAVVTILPVAQYFGGRTLAAGCGAWLALLAFARIFLGRHHPTDVAGSAIIAVMVVGLLWYCVERGAGNAPAGLATLPESETAKFA